MEVDSNGDNKKTTVMVETKMSDVTIKMETTMEVATAMRDSGKATALMETMAMVVGRFDDIFSYKRGDEVDSNGSCKFIEGGSSMTAM